MHFSLSLSRSLSLSLSPSLSLSLFLSAVNAVSQPSSSLHRSIQVKIKEGPPNLSSIIEGGGTPTFSPKNLFEVQKMTNVAENGLKLPKFDYNCQRLAKAALICLIWVTLICFWRFLGAFVILMPKLCLKLTFLRSNQLKLIGDPPPFVPPKIAEPLLSPPFSTYASLYSSSSSF
jgi:hypothetical protein